MYALSMQNLLAAQQEMNIDSLGLLSSRVVAAFSGLLASDA